MENQLGNGTLVRGSNGTLWKWKHVQREYQKGQVFVYNVTTTMVENTYYLAVAQGTDDTKPLRTLSGWV